MIFIYLSCCEKAHDNKEFSHKNSESRRESHESRPVKSNPDNMYNIGITLMFCIFIGHSVSKIIITLLIQNLTRQYLQKLVCEITLGIIASCSIFLAIKHILISRISLSDLTFSLLKIRVFDLLKKTFLMIGFNCVKAAEPSLVVSETHLNDLGRIKG